MEVGFTAEELAKMKIVKNPFFDRLCRKVEVVVRHDVYAIYDEIAKNLGVPAESVMKRALANYAKILQEHP